MKFVASRIALVAAAAVVLGACAAPEKPAATQTPAQSATSVAAAQHPNILIILADDLGYGRVGYHNPKMRTPNIDRFAQEGVRLEHYYAMLNCSPTRAGMLTGRYPIRFGLQSSVVRPWDYESGLPASETTIADQLGKAGYTHRAIYGKWHLGHGKAEFSPMAHGFTEFYGHYNGFVDYYTYVRNDQRDLHHDRAAVPKSEVDGQYLTNVIEHKATDFLDARAKDREPFLLYLPFQNPHAPIQAPPTHMADYADVTDQQARTHMAMVSALDDSVGRILARLDELKLADNTIVVFASDNGGDIPLGSDNGPLRAGKGMAFEGGVRVPCIIRWPREGLSGGRVVDARIAYVDLMPTLLSLAHAPLPQAKLDGINVLPLLKGAPDTGRPLFTMTGAERNEAGPGGDPDETSADAHEATAVNDGEWKLIWRKWRNPRQPQEETMLFNIKSDPNEHNDVAATNPQIVARLRTQIATFRAFEPATGHKLNPTVRPPPGWKAPKDWQLDND